MVKSPSGAGALIWVGVIEFDGSAEMVNVSVKLNGFVDTLESMGVGDSSYSSSSDSRAPRSHEFELPFRSRSARVRIHFHPPALHLTHVPSSYCRVSHSEQKSLLVDTHFLWTFLFFSLVSSYFTFHDFQLAGLTSFSTKLLLAQLDKQ